MAQLPPTPFFAVHTAPDNCLDGSTCLNAVCTAKKGVGGSCATTAACGDLLYCKSGQCTAVATTSGATCDLNDSDSCDYFSGLYCDDITTQCKPVTLVNANEGCGAYTLSFRACTAAGTCRVNGGISGTCVAVVADGQTCNANSDLNCLDPASCEAGVCRLWNPSSCN